MLLLRPDLEDDKLQAAVEKVTRAIVNAGGSLSKVSPWGKRRLAYDIQHHREASYFLIHFDIEPSQVREIERGMLISEEILRHLVTVLEDRGPVDEIAPAAAARSTGDDDQAADEQAADDQGPTDDDRDVGSIADTAGATSGDDAEDVEEPAADAAVAAPAAAEDNKESEVAAVGADAAPVAVADADEERAEG
jgi:small subunit ribosomal protein S6